jgi:hypothetical protein
MAFYSISPLTYIYSPFSLFVEAGLTSRMSMRMDVQTGTLLLPLRYSSERSRLKHWQSSGTRHIDNPTRHFKEETTLGWNRNT